MSGGGARIEGVLDRWERSRSISSCLQGRKTIPACPAEFGRFPDRLDPRLRAALSKAGIERPYSHQAETFERIGQGRHVMIVTPTASGKTLCYNVPVLDAVLADPDSCALYVFPTKALSQDQLAELDRLREALGGGFASCTYDGDTPTDARKAIRERGNVVVTNPDMLHAGILPHHPKWQRFFRSLKFVVIDEAHTYRGIFGSHVANVLRRLRRVTDFHGSSPLFVLCSATVANPAEMAGLLTGLRVDVIDRCGAPAAEKRFLLYNPPVVNAGLGIRASCVKSAARLAASLIEEGVATIVFAQSRLNVELILTYIKETLARSEEGMPRAGKVRAYRGGYLPEQRRQIERGLRSGEIIGVVATNALELGIDIGSLDACVIAGYPGTIASTWQQAGRAGRRGGGISIAVLVGRSDPLDQFLQRNPDFFFGRTPEHGRLDPDNLNVMLDHVKCAAFELPFSEGETYGGLSAEETSESLGFLSEAGVLHRSGRVWHWMADSYPAQGVNIRQASNENFVVVDAEHGGKVIAEVDLQSAPSTLHEGAVYIVEGGRHLVEKLDFENHRAYVRPSEADYFTDAMTYDRVSILDVKQSAGKGGVTFEEGEVAVDWMVVGYKKIKFDTHENLGYGEVNLPEQRMHTICFWFSLGAEALRELPFGWAAIVCGLEGVSHATRHLSALRLMCDPKDIRAVVGDRAGRWFHTAAKGAPAEAEAEAATDGVEFSPTVFMFDNYPGGVGLATEIFSMRYSLLDDAERLISGCGCGDGCPSCTGPAAEGGSKVKEAATAILRMLVRK